VEEDRKIYAKKTTRGVKIEKKQQPGGEEKREKERKRGAKGGGESQHSGAPSTK